MSWTAENAFLICAFAGAGFLFVSLILGDITGGLDSFLESHGIDFFHGSHDGPGFTDSRVLSTFLATFGCIGYLALTNGLTLLGATLSAAVSGFILGGVVYYFAKLLYSQQSNSSVTSQDLLGRSAQVTVSIPAGGVGMVSCRVGEERIEKIARTVDGGAVEAGTTVMIDELGSDCLLVSTEISVGWRRSLN